MLTSIWYHFFQRTIIHVCVDNIDFYTTSLNIRYSGLKEDLNQTTFHLPNYRERLKSTLRAVKDVIAHIKSSNLAWVLACCNVYSLKVQEAHCRLQDGIHRGFKIMIWYFKLNCPKGACSKLAHVQHAIYSCKQTYMQNMLVLIVKSPKVGQNQVFWSNLPCLPLPTFVLVTLKKLGREVVLLYFTTRKLWEDFQFFS